MSSQQSGKVERHSGSDGVFHARHPATIGMLDPWIASNTPLAVRRMSPVEWWGIGERIGSTASGVRRSAAPATNDPTIV